jgi:hypothetical protein
VDDLRINATINRSQPAPDGAASVPEAARVNHSGCATINDTPAAETGNSGVVETALDSRQMLP